MQVIGAGGGRNMFYQCPACQSRAVGRVGFNQFYCWDCCVEYAPSGVGWQVYHLEADGTATVCATTAEVHMETSGEGSERQCARYSGGGY